MIILPYITIKYDFYIGKLRGGEFLYITRAPCSRGVQQHGSHKLS